MFHIVLHVLVPVAIAVAWYRPESRRAGLIMLATMVVDVDHLLADPIYDPQRCSIGFHPLHTWPAIAICVAVFLGALVVRHRRGRSDDRRYWTAEVVALGILIHMALDATDCVL